MIRWIRDIAVERPWYLKAVMFVIAAAFVVSMGWWGFTDSTQPYIAKVDSDRISYDEYGRQYNQTFRLYRDIMNEDFKEETLKRFVLDGLVERRLWLKVAGEFGLGISAEELASVITRDESFKRDGRFDPELYRNILARNRLTPEWFERSIRDDLLIEKAKSLIRDGVSLSPLEIEAVRETLPKEAGPADQLQNLEDQAVQNALFQKRQRVLMGYLSAVRNQSEIDILYQML